MSERPSAAPREPTSGGETPPSRSCELASSRRRCRRRRPRSRRTREQGGAWPATAPRTQKKRALPMATPMGRARRKEASAADCVVAAAEMLARPATLAQNCPRGRVRGTTAFRTCSYHTPVAVKGQSAEAKFRFVRNPPHFAASWPVLHSKQGIRALSVLPNMGFLFVTAI